MTDSHHKALDKLKLIHENNDKNIALIICGSVATGKSRADSDIDLYLVVTDEEYEKVKMNKDYFYGTWNPADFFGIEIDGKIISMQFLEDAVINADEPTRASFQKAYTLFSKNKEVDGLFGKICIYPEHEREEKIKNFYAYVKHYRFVGEQAFRLNNAFHYKSCILELVYFSGRLILAHNRVLYPCRKSLFKALSNCNDMPENFIGMSGKLLEDMNFEMMINYYENIITYFKNYDYSDKERIGLILENEFAWFTKKMPVSDW